MKKLILAVTVVVMMMTMVVGCNSGKEEKVVGSNVSATAETEVNETANVEEGTDSTEGIMGDICINIEGIVVAIDENVITLDNGQKFMINEETAFETQVEGDINSPLTKEVSDVFEIGNFIQGFTMDDLEQEIVVALVINSNGTL